MFEVDRTGLPPLTDPVDPEVRVIAERILDAIVDAAEGQQQGIVAHAATIALQSPLIQTARRGQAGEVVAFASALLRRMAEAIGPARSVN